MLSSSNAEHVSPAGMRAGGRARRCRRARCGSGPEEARVCPQARTDDREDLLVGVQLARRSGVQGPAAKRLLRAQTGCAVEVGVGKAHVPLPAGHARSSTCAARCLRCRTHLAGPLVGLGCIDGKDEVAARSRDEHARRRVSSSTSTGLPAVAQSFGALPHLLSSPALRKSACSVGRSLYVSRKTDGIVRAPPAATAEVAAAEPALAAPPPFLEAELPILGTVTIGAADDGNERVCKRWLVVVLFESPHPAAAHTGDGWWSYQWGGARRCGGVECAGGCSAQRGAGRMVGKHTTEQLAAQALATASMRPRIYAERAEMERAVTGRH